MDVLPNGRPDRSRLEIVRTNFSASQPWCSLAEGGFVGASCPDDAAAGAGHHVKRPAVKVRPHVAPVILDHFPARGWQRSTIMLQHVAVSREHKPVPWFSFSRSLKEHGGVLPSRTLSCRYHYI